MHVSFVKFVREGLNIENIGPMPPPIMLLSDGGHVENLAILPLLKKKLKKIIVVDGGYYSNEKNYGEELLKALMLARRDLNCSFIGRGGRDVISDLLENFVKLQQPNEKKPRHFRYMSMILSVIYCHLFFVVERRFKQDTWQDYRHLITLNQGKHWCFSIGRWEWGEIRPWVGAREKWGPIFFYWFGIASLFLVIGSMPRLVYRVKLGPSSPFAVIFS